jgi:hypothetical protein
MPKKWVVKASPLIVSQDMSGFPEIEIDQINLGRFQSHKPDSSQ